MFRPLAVLPLHLACQFLVSQECTESSVSLATDTPLAKLVTELPDGYAVFKDIGVAYKSYKTKLKWDQARKVCAEDGGYLAHVDSFWKIALIMNIMDSGGYPYVGFHRLFDNTEWTSLKTGLPTAGLPWRWESYDADKGRRCSALWADGSGIYAPFCTEILPFICEIPVFKD